MTQVKLFERNDYELIEKAINQFLQENAGGIKVTDIRYTAETINPNKDMWNKWTAMVIYETL
jgi:hypothetical protein